MSRKMRSALAGASFLSVLILGLGLVKPTPTYAISATFDPVDKESYELYAIKFDKWDVSILPVSKFKRGWEAPNNSHFGPHGLELALGTGLVINTMDDIIRAITRQNQWGILSVLKWHGFGNRTKHDEREKFLRVSALRTWIGVTENVYRQSSADRYRHESFRLQGKMELLAFGRDFDELIKRTNGIAMGITFGNILLDGGYHGKMKADNFAGTVQLGIADLSIRLGATLFMEVRASGGNLNISTVDRVITGDDPFDQLISLNLSRADLRLGLVLGSPGQKFATELKVGAGYDLDMAFEDGRSWKELANQDLSLYATWRNLFQ